MLKKANNNGTNLGSTVRMSISNPFPGSLFANDYICESIVESPDWEAIDAVALDNFETSLRGRFRPFSDPTDTQ